MQKYAKNSLCRIGYSYICKLWTQDLANDSEAGPGCQWAAGPGPARARAWAVRGLRVTVIIMVLVTGPGLSGPRLECRPCRGQCHES